MDSLAASRNSRWDRAPVRGASGLPQRARVTERDIEIFKVLARYRYLTIDDLHGFVGGSRKGLSHHLGLLCREPNLYLRRPPQQRASADANYRPLVYELDQRGRTILSEYGLAMPPRTEHRNFDHELMACRILASFELGTISNPALRFIPWDVILSSPKTPESTRRALRPTHIPVSIALNGKGHAIEICADGKPFGIEYQAPGQRSAYRFFPGIEADTGTEPLQSYDVERSSIFKKFVAYLSIEEKKTYRSHFGFPNFFVPFVTTTEVRMRSMISLLEKVTDGRGSRVILFKCYLSAAASPQFSQVLTDPWRRAGYPSLALQC
jgi:hypothetical protein